ncbi:MAG: UbiA family prenyltransferase [Halobacteriota archaeon]
MLRYSSAYLAIIAMIQVALVMHILSLPLSPAPLVVGLITFSVYANDRVADIDTDELTKPAQSAFVRKHKDTLYLLASIAYGIAVAVSVFGGPLALVIALLPGVFWVLYASHWFAATSTYCRRLKDILFLNTIVVALAWAITLTVLPLAFANATLTPAVGFVFAFFFLGTIINTEIPNVRDVEGDREIGVSTIPTVFGVHGTRRVLYGFTLGTIVLTGYATASGYLTALLAVSILVGLVYLLGVISLLGRIEDDGQITIAAESQYVLAVSTFVVLSITL